MLLLGMTISAKPNFCGSCGNAVKASSAFCEVCGTSLASSDLPVKNFSDESIRKSLKNYERKYNVSCLECGYIGLAGITRWKKKKLKNITLVVSGLFLILCGFLFKSSVFSYVGGGVLVWGGIELSSIGKTVIWVMCPNCSQELGPITSDIGIWIKHSEESSTSFTQLSDGLSAGHFFL